MTEQKIDIFQDKILMGFTDNTKKKRYSVDKKTGEYYVDSESGTKSQIIGILATLIVVAIISAGVNKYGSYYLRIESIFLNISIIFSLILIIIIFRIFKKFLLEKPYRFLIRDIHYEKIDLSDREKLKILKTGLVMYRFSISLIYFIYVLSLIFGVLFIIESQLMLLISLIVCVMLIIIFIPFASSFSKNIKIIKDLIRKFNMKKKKNSNL